MRNEVWGQTLSQPLLPPWGDDSSLSSSGGSILWETVLPKWLQSEPFGLPLGSQPPLAIHLLHCWSLAGPGGASLPQGHIFLTMVFSMGCRGICAPAPGAPPVPPSALPCPWCPQSSSSHTVSFLWRVSLVASWHFLCWAWGKLLQTAHRSHSYPCKPSTAQLYDLAPLWNVLKASYAYNFK